MKTRSKFIISGVLFALFAAFIAVIRTVDVAAIGPEETSVGLSAINKAFHELTGVNMGWYKVAEVLGLAALGMCGLAALFGLWQLITRRSLFKVDSTVYALGSLYALTLGLYALFEKIVVNYRPIIMPEDTHVEASFPSSHTVLAIVVFGSAMIVLGYYVKSGAILCVLRAICAVALAATVFARLWSGAHWLTDIIGGVLIGSSLLALAGGMFDVSSAKDGLANSTEHRHDR